jgi:hypothetical protein
MPSRTYRLDAPLDLRLTLGPLVRGTGDPAMRLFPGRAIRSTRTADGPATLELVVAGRELQAEAWGPGAEAALDDAAALAGLEDDRAGFEPGVGLVGDLDRRHQGLRIGRTGAVLEALVPAILEQKVTGIEAAAATAGSSPGGERPRLDRSACDCCRARKSSRRSPITNSICSASSAAGPT